DLMVLRDDTQAIDTDATLGARARVDPQASPTKVNYVVHRGSGDDLDRERAEEILSPSLFYRGLIFRTTEPIKLVLEPLKDVIHVQLRQDPQTIPKGYKDQFRRHPSEAYIHYNEELQYEIVLKNLTNKPQKISVEYKLDKDPEPPKVSEISLEGKESKWIND